MENSIPGFDAGKATRFLEAQESPFVRLLYLRDIKNVPITEPEFVHQQDAVFLVSFVSPDESATLWRKRECRPRI